MQESQDVAAGRTQLQNAKLWSQSVTGAHQACMQHAEERGDAEVKAETKYLFTMRSRCA